MALRRGWGPDLIPRAAAGGEPVDVRLVAAMRCLLAISALVLFAFDPGEPARFARGAYAVLIAYCIYCVALCAAVLSGRMPVPQRLHHWIDVVACLALLAAGASQVFFVLFFFAVLAASFRSGTPEGIAVTAVSATLLAAVTLDRAGAQPGPAVFEALTRPFYLLLIGCMIAYWGGRELAHRRRVELLRDVAGLVNPRLGLERAIARSVRRLREFYDADACLLVCSWRGSREYMLFRADRSAGAPAPPRSLSAEAARPLLALEPDAALAWRAGRRAHAQDEPRLLANLLETDCFATVPFRRSDGVPGRLYLLGGNSPGGAGLGFLAQVAAQVAAAIYAVKLTEQVMQNATQLARARISRDLHDTTLQPYIGLKLGLEALARKVEPGSPLATPLAELLDMSGQVVADVRGYVAWLRSGEAAARPGEDLLSGLREHIGRYRSFYGIDVELRADASMRVTDRVAGEAYQIVCEALSNIHRHTPAKRAFVELRCDAEQLAIKIGNESTDDAASAAFFPRSIAERAAALGGRAEVQLQRRGHDVVRVAIPL